jgi:endonuclease/exonuclease/phosphatase family metal-dependent hydrolase
MLPVAPRRRDAIREHTDRVAADVWVLTETHDGFSPGLSHVHSSSPGRDGAHGPGHRWVSIWSRHPVEPLPTSDCERTAAVRFMPVDGRPFIVFGTVLPWTGSMWRGHPGAGGAAFREALAVQAGDWLRLRAEYPKDELFILGDFNQDLVMPRYYSSRANRALLEAALSAAGLVCLTAGEGDPIRRDSPSCACIDHICARIDSRWAVEPAIRWPETPVPERWMSDHFGVAITLHSQS